MFFSKSKLDSMILDSVYINTSDHFSFFKWSRVQKDKQCTRLNGGMPINSQQAS
jgi:hypothetical protein